MSDSVNARWSLPKDLQTRALVADPQGVEKLIRLFKKDVAARMPMLRGAVVKYDLATVGSQANAIKGSAIQMGALHLAATCRHLELDAAHHVAGNLQRLLLEAEAEFRVLQTTMHC